MNERWSRAGFSRVCEPPEPAANWLIETLGAVAAWEWVCQVTDAKAQVAALLTELSHRDQAGGGGIPGGADPAGPLELDTDAMRRRQAGLVQAVQRWRARLPVDIDRDLRAVDRLGGQVLIPGDEAWPSGLADLGLRMPVCLWARGVLTSCPRPLGIVGARAASAYGTDVTGEIVDELVRRDHQIISGGAYGIDIAAHRAAVAAGGITHAYLACGVERAYPGGNEAALAAVLTRGAWLSEYPVGAQPLRHRFLARNRLIAAAAAGTVVVEASWRSGALNTAHQAAELGRPVGAVPGSVRSAQSQGTHRLLREGHAILVTDAAEIIELIAPLQAQLELDNSGEPGSAELGPQGLQVWGVLADRKVQDLTRLATVAGLSPWEVSGILGTLELAGFAAQRGGGWVRDRPAGRAVPAAGGRGAMAP